MAYRSISTNSTPSTSLSVTPPSGIQDGDVLVMFTVSDDSGATLTFPGGFTKLTGSPRVSTIDGMTLEVATKVASSESGNYAVSSSAAVVGGVACFTGIDTASVPYRQSNGQSSVNNDSPWSMTSASFSSNTDVACDLVFIGGSDSISGAVVTSGPSGYTNRGDVNSTLYNIGIATADAVASGVTGAATMVGTLAGAAAGWGCFHLALKNTSAGTTLYFLDSAASGSNFGSLQVGGSAPTTATTATGWTVDTVASGNYALMAYASERASSNFSGTAQPAGNPDNSLGDCFRSTSTMSGDFATGAWTIAVPVIAVSAAAGQDGRVRVRLWRSTSATGASATEITSGAVAGTTVTNLTTGAEQVSTVTTSSITGFSMTAEYLFVQIAWEITGAAA